MGKHLKGALFRFAVPTCILGLMILLLHDFFLVNTSYYQLAHDTLSGEDFRNMSFPDGGLACLYALAGQWEENPYDVITSGCLLAGTAFALSHKEVDHV